MKIKISRLGGFAGVSVAREYEWNALPEEQRLALTHLDRNSIQPAVMDAFTYVVEQPGTDGFSRKTTLNEFECAPTLRSVLRALTT